MTHTDTPAAPARKRSFLRAVFRGIFKMLGALSYAFIRVFFFILFSPPVMFLAAVFVLIVGYKSGALQTLAGAFAYALAYVIDFAWDFQIDIINQ